MNLRNLNIGTRLGAGFALIALARTLQKASQAEELAAAMQRSLA